MHVATIGSDPLLDVRRRLLAETDGIHLIDVPSHRLLGETLEQVDVLFIAVPRAERFRFAAQAARSGTHVFVEWPPATSIRECAALVRLAEESGVECAVSRPLRFSPVMDTLSDSFRASLVSLSLYGSSGSPPSQSQALVSLMADAVDLSCALAKSSSVRRIDAEAARDETSQPEAVMFSLRFHSGAYAHVFINLNGTPTSQAELYAAGSGDQYTGRLSSRGSGISRETIAFVEAVRTGRPVPVATLDALHTMRIVERLQGLLR